MTPAQREAVVAEATTWLHTPYHPHGRLKHVGVDCAQILLAIYPALGLGTEVDPGNYAQDWHMNRNEEQYIRWLETAGAVRTSDPQPGDIALFRFGRCFSHGAILVGERNAIHAYVRRGVILTSLDEDPLYHRPVIYWTLP